MAETDIAIRTFDLSRNFGQRRAVNEVNIEIKKGELFSLLGTNGAGKTTTIKMLCCLLKPSSGKAVILGHDIRDDEFKIKSIISISPQETAVAGHLSTMENLVLMGGISGLRLRESKLRAKRLMEMIELEDRRDQARRLSGGMQRRLSIAMALMSDPQVLFLDEPTLGLDPHARRSVWTYIARLKGEKTILLTTHYLEEADALADNIAIMDSSKIIDSGTPGELKRRYQGIKVLSIHADNLTPGIMNEFRTRDLEVREVPAGMEISAKEIDFYAVIDKLKSHQVKITALHMQQPSLDDVFLKLTGKEGEV